MKGLREAFLGRFNSSLRPQIIEYGKKITAASRSEDAVMMIMSRKAVCLIDCLRRLNLVSLHCPITSDRVLDMNTSWLKGRKVFLVDDALISGTTLYHTTRKLVASGIDRNDIKPLVLCVNTKWWSKELVTPLTPYLELDENETASLCASIVEAFSIFPRPYSVDYPVFRRLRIPAGQVEFLSTMPGWAVDEVTSPLQTKHGIFSITFTPIERLCVELDESLGWNFSSNALMKIRLYGRLTDGVRPAFWCSAVPMIAAKPLPTNIVIQLFESLRSGSFSEIPFDGFFNADHLRGEERTTAELCAKLRFICFLASYRFGKVWYSMVKQEIQNQTRFTDDESDLACLFPAPFAATVRRLASQDGLILFRDGPSFRMDEETVPENHEGLGSGQLPVADESILESRLMKPFIDLYNKKELRARELVLEHGKNVFDLSEWRDIINRLNTGYSISEIDSWLGDCDSYLDTTQFVSLFLDRLIDRGCVVPITYRNNGIIARGYRHGEDVEFGEAEERMCVLMLDALARSSGSTLLPHMWVEKGLVLLIRVGLEQGFFNYWNGRLGDYQSMGIRYSLHGAVVATGSSKLYHTSESMGLTEIMESQGHITRMKKEDPWKVVSVPLGGFHVDRASKARNVGLVFGSLLGDGTLSTQDLTLIATGLYPKDIAGALAAEIDIAGRDIEQLYLGFFADLVRSENLHELEAHANKLRKRRFFFCAANGTWKFRECLRKGPWEIIDRVSNLMSSDELKQNVWNSFWSPEGRQSETAISEELRILISREGFWLYKLSIYCFLLDLSMMLGLQVGTSNRESIDIGIGMVITEIRKSVEEIHGYFSAQSEITRYVENILQALKRNELQTDKLLDDLRLRFKYLVAEAKEILSEVDCLAANIGRAEAVSHYYQVLHIALHPAERDRGGTFRRLFHVFHEYRGKAHGNKTMLSEIPREQTPLHYGIWLCSRGSMARVWLIRTAVRLLKEFSLSSEIRLVLFPDLPENAHLRKPECVAEFDGPTFWGRVTELYRTVLNNRASGQIYVVTDRYQGDPEGVRREILTEAKGSIHPSFNKIEYSVEEPLPQEIVVTTYGLTAATKGVNKRGLGKSRSQMDVGLITVVPDELMGIKKVLSLKERKGKLTTRSYYEGVLSAASGSDHRVICMRTTVQGNQSVMAAYRDIWEEFSPVLIVLIGIGGSVNKDALLCDVVFADSVLYYDRRAQTVDGAARRLQEYNINMRLLNEINKLFDSFGDKPRLPAVSGSYRDRFGLLMGPLGTGEAVIKYRDAEERAWLLKVNDKTLALDTESAGLCRQFAEDRLKYGAKPEGYLIVRGISDHADIEKNDDWRQPAAGNAVLALQQLLSRIPSGGLSQIARA